jgi:methylenetetrahydrofolate dehydrogenase (NADP+)/methenyltetrahydrofolate cyclohydrolase
MREKSLTMFSPDKDVDGFNATNLGLLCQEQKSAFISCTPAGIVELLKEPR